MIKLGSDSAGRLLLSLSGDCNDAMASVLQEGTWDVLTAYPMPEVHP